MNNLILNRLKKYFPNLYSIAIELNEKDNFKMFNKDDMLNKKRGKNNRNNSRRDSDDSSSSDSSSSSSLCSEDFC